MTYERRNKGTCSVMTKVELNPDHTIESVEVLGGCNGNLKGICQLLTGMKACRRAAYGSWQGNGRSPAAP